jgi:hypothetical protein
MKIKDILDKYRMLEDDSMKIKSVSGNDVTLDQGGQEIKTTTDALVPAADKPGSFAMKPADPNQIKPGAEVTQPTQEEMGDDEEHPATKKHYHDWMSSEYAPHDDDSGDHDAVHTKAIHFLHSRGVNPGDIEFHAHHMAHKFHGGIDEIQSVMPSRNNPALAQQAAQSQPGHQSVMPSRNVSTQEGHRDLISQGDEDVGGDPTGGAGYKRGFINDIVDKDFERKNRSPGADGQASPINKREKRLPESDELMKWLTIAGVK